MHAHFHGANPVGKPIPIAERFLALFPLALLGIVPSSGAVNATPPSPHSQGTIFIREKISDEKSFKTAFEGLRPDFKANGFLAYSLHKDLNDPAFLILTLQCTDLEKGISFIKSAHYKNAMEEAGVKEPVQWSGVDVTPRLYGALPLKPAGIVIARNELISYAYWKAFYDAEHDPAHGGKNKNKQSGYHPERHYVPSHYSIHRGLGKPDVAYVVHEASDVSKAPEFMNSPPMEAMKSPLGIKGFHVWYGYNLEQGFF